MSQLAALFWFYKEFDICRERLLILRRLNPEMRVYGLYAGHVASASTVRERLGDVLDDLYVYEGVGNPEWRWIHGDRVIAQWYTDRGLSLGWGSVVVVQWDALIAASFAELLAALHPGEAAFSGDRPLAEVEDWWGWGGAGSVSQSRQLADFHDTLLNRFEYDGPLWCCLFITAVLPREFLARYAAEAMENPGFLEYKLPTFARVFDIPVRKLASLEVWWSADPGTRDASPCVRVMNATGEAVDETIILRELDRPNGRRIFHPVFRTPAALMEEAAR